MKRTFIIALCAFVLGGCASDDRTPLVVYSPHGKEMLTEYESLFEAAHPEVNVQWIDMGGQDAYDRIRTEKANPAASIWWGWRWSNLQSSCCRRITCALSPFMEQRNA